MTIIPPEHDPLLQMMARAEPMIPESKVRERIAGAVAAERERCAQLAEQHQARYRACGEADHRPGFSPADCKAWGHRKPFADLLRQGGEGGGT